MLKIGGKYSFEDNLSNRRSCLMFFDEDDPVSWSVDIGFSEEDFGDETVSPVICINPIDTDKNSVEELVGEKFKVATVEECADREDTFYIYEFEPMVSYEVEVLEIKDNNRLMIGQNLRIVSVLQIMFEQLRGVLNKEVCVMSRLREETIVTVKKLWR